MQAAVRFLTVPFLFMMSTVVANFPLSPLLASFSPPSSLGDVPGSLLYTNPSTGAVLFESLGESEAFDGLSHTDRLALVFTAIYDALPAAINTFTFNSGVATASTPTINSADISPAVSPKSVRAQRRGDEHAPDRSGAIAPANSASCDAHHCISNSDGATSNLVPVSGGRDEGVHEVQEGGESTVLVAVKPGRLEVMEVERIVLACE